MAPGAGPTTATTSTTPAFPRAREGGAAPGRSLGDLALGAAAVAVAKDR